MRVLITGGDGFIGSHLADALRPEHEVAVIDNWETGLQRPGTYECDISSRYRFYEFSNRIKPELVIHCAASYKDPNKWHRDVDTNVTGTINALLVAKHHGARLVYFQTALPPVSSYAISKIAGEQYIRQSGVSYLIFRLANVYGPRNLSGPIPAFFKRLQAGEPCTVVQTERDMVYIDDLLECVLNALENDRRGAYDVCSGRPVTILSLYRAVAKHFPPQKQTTIMPPSRDDLMPNTSVHNWLEGWAPRTELQDGVDKAVEWYSEHGVANTYTHLAMKG